MKSLNTYNYREELYMKPISYQVTVSDNDKVIKIEDDGDLIAELSFDVDGNTLFLNGKDGLEVAQVELPIALASIVKQQYNAETKEIELSILKTNGETTVFGLDVAELVNVYTAGDGIDITDNMISIKIKDEKGPLHVDKHGLCIDMNTLATSDDVDKINTEISQIKSDVSTLTEHVNTSINTINENVADGFNTINENVANGFHTINAAIATEKEERIASDEAIQKQLGNVTEGLQGSITDVIKDLEEQIGDVKGDLEGSITDAIKDLEAQIGNVKGDLEGSITDNISTIKTALEVEIKARESGDDELSEQIAYEKEGREKQCADIAKSVDDLNNNLSSNVEALNQALTDNINIINNQMAGGFAELTRQITEEVTRSEEKDKELSDKINSEIERAESVEEGLQTSLKAEINVREEGDLRLQKQLGDGFLSAVENSNARSFGGKNVTEKVQEIEYNLSNEIQAREDGDNKTFNAISVEKEERKKADYELDNKLSASITDLSKSIKLEKDVNNNLKYTLYVNGVSAGELNIPEDNMIESVSYNQENQTLTFNWKTSIPQDPTVVDLSSLVDVYSASDGVYLDGSTFKLNVQHSKYIDLQENGSAEFVGVFKKREGTSWIYDIVGKNGENNGKFIDFTSDYEAYDAHIKETYAPLTYVNEQDNLVKTTLIGVDGDSEQEDTLYGLRAAIAKSEEVMSAKIDKEQTRAEGKETDLGAKIDVTKDGLTDYVNQEIGKVNETISANAQANTTAHGEMAQNIKANSDILSSLTNGEKNGIVDKLNRQFHEITSGIDENAFEGLIKSLMNRISVLENTINILVGSADVNGSVANVVAKCLADSKSYTDTKSTEALENAKIYADDKFQLKGEYITEIDGKYVTEEELEKYKYIDETELNTVLDNYLPKELAESKYQEKGNYLTGVPEEFVTETELIGKGYATKEYVNNQDKNFLTKDIADLLYAATDVNDRYVKTSDLNNADYASKSYVQNLIPSLDGYATRDWVDSQGFIKTVPAEYVTESELLGYNFVTKSDLVNEKTDMTAYVNTMTHDMLTKSEASTTYQLKGEYVTENQLTNNSNSLKNYIDGKVITLATKDELKNYQPIGNYVTMTELDNKNYVDKNYISGLGYVNQQTFNEGLNAKVDKTYAENTYATKQALQEHMNSAFTINDINVMDNIYKTVNGKQVTLGVKLSEGYSVEDTYNQNLPQKGDNLDTVSQRLSIALKDLLNTTDGELF